VGLTGYLLATLWILLVCRAVGTTWTIAGAIVTWGAVAALVSGPGATSWGFNLWLQLFLPAEDLLKLLLQVLHNNLLCKGAGQQQEQ